MRSPVYILLVSAILLGAREASLHEGAQGQDRIAISQDAALDPAGARRTTAPSPAARIVRSTSLDIADKSSIESLDTEELRARIRRGERGTYIGEILLARDSSLTRWPERVEKPLRVWVADGSSLPDWRPDFPSRVREAFTEWSLAGIPVLFTFVVDSSDADIHVSWEDQFDQPISGKTHWSRDRRWWIVGGSIVLALHHNERETLDGPAIRAIALHEVGHLLGLDHSVDTSNIMTSRVRVRDLSDADRATIKLLYSLPPGSIR
ncbi:MAG: matrixin family metalloprotease [Gemmatimonadaceae bacterium]